MPKSLLLRTETVRYEDAEVTVQCRTIMSQIELIALAERMQAIAPEPLKVYTQRYAQIVVQTQTATGLGFDLPAFDAPDEAHLAALQDYLRVSQEFVVDYWLAACDRVNKPFKSDPDLAPGVVKSDDPK